MEVPYPVYPVNYKEPKAIVVRCPDRRFRIAHKRFIREELGLKGEDFWPLKPAGGAAAIARPGQMPAKFESVMEDICLFIRHSPIRHIILINHEDCRRYDALVGKNRTDLHQERADLLAAVRLLLHKYPNIEISAFFAKFADAERTAIFFETVCPSQLRVDFTRNQLALI